MMYTHNLMLLLIQILHMRKNIDDILLCLVKIMV